uniref:Villin-1 n=1 Tax=Ciona intestinalis TaxID=7719 RepID=F7AKV1_CIOIN|nr:villin-1 isoform X2 [Ciona intestinalis]|eukprot:XP_018668862.1 villin-1 isoform X2 [Ciona intestinalis]
MAPEIFHEEFEKAGKREGMEIWRVENMEVVPIPKKSYGSFFSGDAYIILVTRKMGSGASYNLHFWLGNNSSTDEQGAAAMLATQLDDYLGGDPVQYRETQGNESTMFKAYFKSGIVYCKGGVASGFKHVETNQYDVRRLLRVKGRKTVNATEQDFAWTSFNLGDVFLVDLGKIIIQWNGPESNRMERLKATILAKDIRDRERGGRGQVLIVDGENEKTSDKAYGAMLKLLGDKPKLNPAIPDEIASRNKLSQLKLFHVTDQTGQLTVQEVATKPLTQDLLNHDDCYILDQGGSNIFVWKGKSASKEERSGAMQRAIGYMEAKGYSHHTKIEAVPDGAESAMFKQLFKGWRSHNETVGRGSTYTRGNIAKVAHVKFDATTMHAQPELAAQHRMVDDGSGDVEIWRIENNELAEVDRDTYGQFYGGDCYLILYTYLNNGKKNYIIYYWQGRHATQDEITASAFHAVALDDKYDGAPVQIRVIMGKEPKHFMAMFKGKLIIFEGGTSRKTEEPTEAPARRLFQVRGTNEFNTKAVEVSSAASSLNSNDVFLFKTPLEMYMWCGKGCSGDEREMAKNVSKVISHRDLETVSEGNESTQFWAALGGKVPYANSPKLQEADEASEVARLFECSNASGNFVCEEICNFSQEDLDEDDVMLLDTHSELFLWIGKGANKQEKEESLVTAINYLRTDPTGSRDPHTPIITVKQGFEPPIFSGWFMAWDPSKWSGNKTYEDLKRELGGQEDLFDSMLASALPARATQQAAAAASTTTNSNSQPANHVDGTINYYGLDKLTVAAEDLPPDVDATKKEQHLSDSDFELVFGMSKLDFSNKPAWKQSDLKKKQNLF